MADALYELLRPDGEPDAAQNPPSRDVLLYLEQLSSQSISSITSTEPQKLSQGSHTNLLSLQALAKKSHTPIIEAATHHATLSTSLPALAASAANLRHGIPRLDDAAAKFSSTYNRSHLSDTTSSTGEDDVLVRRKQALLLSRNVERLVDILELPTLLTSAITSSPPNYPQALDLNGHIRRLHALYPSSPLVASVGSQADEAMHIMAENLIRSLQAPALKLAAALRTIGWLRRVLPDLQSHTASHHAGSKDARRKKDAGPATQQRVLEGIFLTCRLATLTKLLHALEPLRDLADQERARQKSIGSGNAWSGGQQTERYLKRYIEIFREHSFAIVSMYKSIFPDDGASGRSTSEQGNEEDRMPPALTTFPMHLVETLLKTLRAYLPTVKDQASRDSLLTQVLYCAGSLGRLGGDFGLMLAGLDLGGDAEEEWVEVVRRHRQMAGRLESMVGSKEKATA